MKQEQSKPLEHWGLERWPFPSVPSAGLIYPSAGHEEALARIDYLVGTQRRLGVLLGEVGIGKTLTLQAAARQMARQRQAVVIVDALGLGTREMLWQVAAGLGAAPDIHAELPKLWRLVADRVIENRWQQIDTVLIVDDAGQVGPDLATQLTRLSRIDPTPAARWTILLAAEADQVGRWGETLRELVDLRIELMPWDDADVVGFLQSALVEAGREEPLFDDDALEALSELSGGIPRRLARLADLAMLAGAAARAATVDASLVHAADDEVRWYAPARVF